MRAVGVTRGTQQPQLWRSASCSRKVSSEQLTTQARQPNASTKSRAAFAAYKGIIRMNSRAYLRNQQQELVYMIIPPCRAARGPQEVTCVSLRSAGCLRGWGV